MCRITDLSLGGCFVHALAMPTPGEETRVTINFGPDVSMTFTGTVLYVERGLGFAVKFHDLSQGHSEEVARMIAALGAPSS